MRRTTRTRARAMGKLLIVAVIVGGVSTTAYVMSRSAAFGLSRIDVTGNHSLTRQEVIGASGLHVGTDVLSVDLRAAAARVRDLPAVESAGVIRTGALAVSISIVERAPGVVLASGARRWYGDRSGEPMDVAAVAPRGLPVIDVGAIGPGDDRARDAFAVARPILAPVLALWPQLPSSTRAHITRFVPQADGSIVFRAYGATIVFGSVDQIHQKARAIALVTRAVAEDGGRMTRLDVTAPLHPAARIS